MATAVEPGSEPRTPTPPMSLPLASILGAVYVVATIAAVFFVLPSFWAESVAPSFHGSQLASGALLGTACLAAFVALLLLGRVLAGNNPPHGVRGGIFLVLLFGTLIFFVWDWLATSIEGGAGMIAAGVIAAFLVFLLLRFINGKTGESWMIGLEELGWFSTATYKSSLGQKARRITMLGIILLGGSGVLAMSGSGDLPKDWTISLPFGEQPNKFVLIPNADSAIPLALGLLTLWFAWRAVNVPSFAEFLIATEAEMNKVSWTPRKRLAQDTVVVLTTTLLMALFLLVVDLFWGWLLSRQTIDVLPGKATKPDDARKPAERARW